MEQDEKINSFPYEATVGGICHYYRITENEGAFGIEQDGLVIATVQNAAGQWQQVSGRPMSKELLDSICDHIEGHYS